MAIGYGCGTHLQWSASWPDRSMPRWEYSPSRERRGDPTARTGFLRVRPPERVLKAQIKEYASFAGARADADGYGHSGNDLEAALEVVCPSNSRADIQRLRPLRPAGSHDGLKPAIRNFQEEIEPWVRHED